MSKYIFNEHGVCLNPKVHIEIENKNNKWINCLTITTAEIDGKFISGYRVQLELAGCSCGSSIYDKRFDTEDEAFNEAVERVQNFCEQNKPSKTAEMIIKELTKLNPILQIISNYRNSEMKQEQQLSLF